LAFIEEAQLDRVGAFKYSPVEGAAANELDNHVDDETKEQRLAQFMQRQAIISEAKLASKVGTTIDVIIDDVDDQGAVARGKADAPEIDGLVYLNEETHHQPGDIIRVKVHASDEHDLWANSVA
jgi:ribosomal protein S12 methylthiotransferase